MSEKIMMSEFSKLSESEVAVTLVLFLFKAVSTNQSVFSGIHQFKIVMYDAFDGRGYHGSIAGCSHMHVHSHSVINYYLYVDNVFILLFSS